MKIECVKDKLSEAVFRTEKIASKSATLPVLKCLLFNATKGVLEIKATNLDVGVECTVPVKVEVQGKVAIIGGVLANFLNNLGDSRNINIESINEGGVQVSSDKTKTTIKTLNSDDFPDLPHVTNPVNFEIESNDFINGLKSVWYSSATTSIKPELSSIRIYEKDGQMVFVATDGFRLAEKKVKIKNTPDINHILIPNKNAGEIIRLLEGVTGVLGMSVEQGQVEIKTDNMRIVSRTIEGVFPDYQAIIPKEFSTEAKILKQDLLNTLRLTNLFSDNFNQIVFNIIKDDNSVEISSKNKDLGEHTSKIDSFVKGEDIKIQFNCKYLTDCLSSIKSDTIVFSFAGKQKPIVVKGENDKEFLYLMMPMNG